MQTVSKRKVVIVGKRRRGGRHPRLVPVRRGGARSLCSRRTGGVDGNLLLSYHRLNLCSSSAKSCLVYLMIKPKIVHYSISNI